jgi:hypothetical protein
MVDEVGSSAKMDPQMPTARYNRRTGQIHFVARGNETMKLEFKLDRRGASQLS